ncbi:MAG: hypothetical protein ACE5J4_02625 [Candidatus Aenigmatarchaeota archaeon]
MKKGIAIVLIATILAISLISLQKTGIAENKEMAMEANAEKLISEAQGVAVRPVPPYYPRSHIEMYKGTAYDRFSLQRESVMLLRIYSYGEDQIYFLVGGEIHELRLVDIINYGDTWIVKAMTYRGEDLLIFVQENHGTATITGLFRNYFITFEPYGYPKPIPPQPVPCYEEPIIPFLPFFTRTVGCVEPTQTAPLEQTQGVEPFWRS